MKTLSVPLPHRNRHYGNERYDKTYRILSLKTIHHFYENPRSIVLIEKSIGNNPNEAEACTRDGNTYKQSWSGKEDWKCYH